MPNTLSETSTNQSPTPMIIDRKVVATPLGLEFREDIDYAEWRALAGQIATSLRCMAFAIGDWLVYGEKKFDSRKRQGRVDQSRYELAVRATGIDYAHLRNYAYVSRRVPLSLRNDRLSWDHHRAVAKLPPEHQGKWLDLACQPGDYVSSRRLRASINADRLVSVEELVTPPGDQAIITHIPPINRLVLWWRETGGRDWLRTRSKAQLRNMLVDFRDVIDIVKALQSEFQLRPDDQ